MNLGWSCMSWRQPAVMRRESIAETSANRSLTLGACRIRLLPPVLMGNFGHLSRLQCFQELADLSVIEQRIYGFDAQEKTVAAGERESRHVKRRMVRHRQSAQREQAQHRRDRRDQNRHLE